MLKSAATFADNRETGENPVQPPLL